jgi:hypothetical protein
MKRIMSMRVTQIRIFRSDEIPFAQLQSGVASQKLAQALGLQLFAPPQPVPGLPIPQVIYGTGQLKENEKITVIEQLAFDERRIVLMIAGDSRTCNKVFEVVRKIIIEIDQRQEKPAYEPLILSEETMTILKLDFPITKLLKDGSLETFGKDLTTRVENLGAKAQAFVSSVHFRIHYDDLPDLLKKQGISLLDKEVAIEWRQQSAVDDNIFFITSPNSSDDHLQLIQHLEELFAN